MTPINTVFESLLETVRGEKERKLVVKKNW